MDVVWYPKSKVKNVGYFSASWSVRRPKIATVKNINVNAAEILGPEISANIDISKGNIDPALVCYDLLCSLSAMISILISACEIFMYCE